MNPYDAAHALTKTLRESTDFKELKEAQTALKTDNSAREMLIDFRTEQLNLQKQQISGIKVSTDQEEKLQKLFEVISMNTVIKQFLQAEYKVAVLLRDVHKIISNATGEIIDPELMVIPEDDHDTPDA